MLFFFFFIFIIYFFAYFYFSCLNIMGFFFFGGGGRFGVISLTDSLHFTRANEDRDLHFKLFPKDILITCLNHFLIFFSVLCSPFEERIMWSVCRPTMYTAQTLWIYVHLKGFKLKFFFIKMFKKAGKTITGTWSDDISRSIQCNIFSFVNVCDLCIVRKTICIHRTVYLKSKPNTAAGIQIDLW